MFLQNCTNIERRVIEFNVAYAIPFTIFIITDFFLHKLIEKDI